LALACDEILLVDDRSAAVSLPEVPLLGVLPERRADPSDGQATRATGPRRHLLHAGRGHPRTARTAMAVDRRSREAAAVPQAVRERAQALAESSDRPHDATGIALTPLARTVDDKGYRYEHVTVAIDRRAPLRDAYGVGAEVRPAEGLDRSSPPGASWWPLAMARELDDAILLLRTNELDIGTWVLKTEGDASHVLAADAALCRHQSHWFVRETIGMLRRTLARLDVTSRTLFALVEPGSCFAGTLFELALAADRSYMLAADVDAVAAHRAVRAELRHVSDGQRRVAPRCALLRRSRTARPCKRSDRPAARPSEALDLGLVTAAPTSSTGPTKSASRSRSGRACRRRADRHGSEPAFRRRRDDGDPRVRAAVRVAELDLHPPNAVGETGALKVFGTGNKARFNWDRV
jgi:benzoyl-CoA-dihydrodiol lyase